MSTLPKSILDSNKTSARLLRDYAEYRLMEKSGETGDPDLREKRFFLINDLYIKARSYALINKVTFWLSILAGLAVIGWPSFAIIANDLGCNLKFLESAVVQTSVTAVAALLFAVYSHYKKRQTHIENLMRLAVFSDEPLATLAAKIIDEVSRIDSGFAFSQATFDKETPSGKKSPAPPG